VRSWPSLASIPQVVALVGVLRLHVQMWDGAPRCVPMFCIFTDLASS
jgi:hypothetical protein